MTADDITVAPCQTHHLRGGAPAYAERFDEVASFHAPGLAPVRRDGYGWHIHPTARAAYTRRFSRTFGFYERLAAVASHDGWHHILPSGEDAYAPRYAWCGNFQESRCAVRERGGAYLHITPRGEPAYDTRWRYAGDFRHGLGVVQANDGRSTHIDRDGRTTHGRWFLDLDAFHKGFARAQDLGGWMHINFEGEPIYSNRLAAVEPFYNGHARVEHFDGSLEVIDEAGRAVIVLRGPRG